MSTRCMRVIGLVVTTTLFVAIAAVDRSNGETIPFMKHGDTCPGPAGTVNIAGKAANDFRVRRSATDKNRQYFELWCIDQNHFGLRFVRENPAGQVMLEKWVGICPYNGGLNEITLTRTVARDRSFVWTGSTHISTDFGADDDGDGKRDSVKCRLNVDRCRLVGFHSENGRQVDDDTVVWTRTPGQEPFIPGDPASTVDGPSDLLCTLTRSIGCPDLELSEGQGNNSRIDVTARVSGSSRFVGDSGLPVVFTNRLNAESPTNPTDDNITVTAVIDNMFGGPVSRTFRICTDLSVIVPTRGATEITGAFTPVGGGGQVMNPLTFLPGRTVLRLEMTALSAKTKLGSIVNRLPANLPIRVLVDEPGADADACALDGSTDVDETESVIGLRRRPGSSDDDSAEAFVVVRPQTGEGDSINAVHRAVDMPKVPHVISGVEVVLGEFGGSGLPGLDAVEVRRCHLIFPGSPDLSPGGLVRTVGAVDGVGSVAGGPPPTTVVLNVADYPVDPATAGDDLFVRAVLLAGQISAVTAVGVDQDPTETLLGDASFTLSGDTPANDLPSGNAMLRLLLDGDHGTLETGAYRRTGSLATDAALKVLISE